MSSLAKPLVSVLIPSRGRSSLLKEAVDSLGDVEVLIAIDEDDPEKTAYYDTDYGNAQMIECPRYGYGYLDRYYNDLARKSTGKWLMLWNDDAEMRSGNWLDILAEVDTEQPHIAIFGEEKCFPLINRVMYNVLGHFSQGPSNDTYLLGVADRSNGLLKLSSAEIYHKRDYIHDQTEKDKTRDFKLSDKRQRSDFVVNSQVKDAKAVELWLKLHSYKMSGDVI